MSKKRKTSPHTPHPTTPPARVPPSPSKGEGLRVTPNKNRLPGPGETCPRHVSEPPEAAQPVWTVSANKHRLVQVRRTGGRKLFDKAAKELFLEWLAATCNASLAAEMAGVAYQTPFKHLQSDPAFEEAFGRALRIGYVRLEARVLQEAHQPGFGPSGTVAEGGHPHPAQAELESPSPAASRVEGQREEYEVRCGLDDEQVEEHFDPQLALQLLREHARRLSGSPEKRRNQRTTAQSATGKEIAEALAKRLKGFALRHDALSVIANETMQSGLDRHAAEAAPDDEQR